MSTENKIEISASIMCIDWMNVADQMSVLEKEGIDSLHWDVVDGAFAPDFTMGSSIINTINDQTTIKSNYHFMVEEPSRIFDSFEYRPDDVVVIHQECCRNLHRDLVKLKKMGCKVGVAICPATSIGTLEYVLEEIDVVLVMTVNPGFKGQKLVPQTLYKIFQLRNEISKIKPEIQIEVDGNVSPEFMAKMVAAGADILVGGSSGLFRSDMPLEKSIANMREEIERGLSKRPSLVETVKTGDRTTFLRGLEFNELAFGN